MKQLLYIKLIDKKNSHKLDNMFGGHFRRTERSTSSWWLHVLAPKKAPGHQQSLTLQWLRDINLPNASYCAIYILHCSQRHYNDVIMSATASQITSPTFVYSTVYSGADEMKHQSSASLAFVRGIHRWLVNFPAQRASNAEKGFIWWRLMIEQCSRAVVRSQPVALRKLAEW